MKYRLAACEQTPLLWPRGTKIHAGVPSMWAVAWWEALGEWSGEGDGRGQAVTPGRDSLVVASEGTAGVNAHALSALYQCTQKTGIGAWRTQGKKNRKKVHEIDRTCEAAAESV